MREIPKEVQNLINHYFKLRINSKFVKVPYHINVKHVRGELRSLVGKGSPEEIEDEVNIFAKLRKFNIAQATPEETREFMQKEGIGIDCSGLVTHILNTWTKSENKGSISSNLTFPKLSLRRRIRVWIRPIENINAELLTNQDNTVKIELREVQAGDLIRLKGLKKGDHIAVITEVKRDENGVKEVVYVHSSRYYGKDNGIRQGRIHIKNESEDLEKQDWLEKDEDGVCWTLKEFLKEKEDNGFRRPKFFMNKK